MALPQAGVELVAQGLDSFVSGMGRADDAVQKFGRSGADSGSTFDKGFSEIVVGGLRQIGALGVEALVSAGQAVAGFVKDSIGLAGEFESGMLEFQAVAGKGVDTAGLEEFRDLFIDIGKRLPVSTSEVQKAAIEMVKGGIEPAAIAAGGLEQIIQFASAAMGGDLVQAAEVSSKILGGWTEANATAAEKADFLTHSTDLLTKAANASSVDVHELALGIFNAQGIAKTAGVPFDDLTTTLALLAPRFASSSEAGNSLKNMIARLQPTTKPATEAMAALGLWTDEAGSAFYDAQGNFVGFEKASQLLQGSLKGLTKEQQTALLQQIFGNDAMSAAAALAEGGAEAYQHMAEGLANANGVMENAALKQQGFDVALDNAKGSVEALQITLGSALLPILTDLLNNYIAPGINMLTDMSDAVFGNEEAFNRLSPPLQDIVGVIQTVITDVGNIVTAFNDAGAGSDIFADALADLAADLGLPGDLIKDMIGAIQDVVAWIGDLIDGFLGVEKPASMMAKALGETGSTAETLGKIFRAAFDAIMKTVQEVFGTIEKYIPMVMDAIQKVVSAVLEQITAFWQSHGAEIMAFVQTTWETIGTIINTAVELIMKVVIAVLGKVAEFITKHADDIQTILGGAWDVISGIIDGALTLIQGILQAALAAINGDWEGAWTAIQEMSVRFVEDIGQVIKGFLDIIAGFFGSSVDEIISIWQHNWDMLVQIATQTDWARVGRDVVDGIIAGLAGAWSSLVGWIQDRVSGLVDAALDAVGAGSPATEFMPVGQFSVQGIMAGFSEWWPSLTKLVEGLGEDLVKQAQDIAMAVQSQMASAFGATASIDRQVADNLDRLDQITSDFYRKHAAGALEQARITALGFADPAEGAKFFAMRSKQIFEEADLKEQLAKAETVAEQERIKKRLALINNAQIAEINAFNAQLDASKSGVESLAESIQALLGAQGQNARGQPVGLPGILESPTIAAITSLLGQLIRPPASPSQQLYGGGASYYNQSTVNMPVYTNQSPSVIQDSAAIAWSALP